MVDPSHTVGQAGEVLVTIVNHLFVEGGLLRATRRGSPALALAVWVCLGSGCGQAPGSPTGQDRLDADPDTTVVYRDAEVSFNDAYVTDASPPPTGTPYDFCHTGFFQLPTGSETERSFSWSLGDRGIAYTRRHIGLGPGSLYYFDLQTCTEYEIVSDSDPWGASLDGDEMLYLDDDINPVYWRDNHMAAYNLTTWTSQIYFDSEYVTWPPILRGRWVLFTESTTQWDSNPGPEEVVLHDRLLQTYEELEDEWYGGGDYVLGDEYAAWYVRCDLNDSIDYPCVKVRELSTGHTRLLDVRSAGCWLQIGGEYLTYCNQDARYASSVVFILHNIATDATQIITDQYATYQTPIEPPLLVHGTSADTGSNYSYDFELLDIDTWQSRRLTAVPCSDVVVRDIHYPWVVFTHDLDHADYTIWLAHLELLGVTDASGVLIPGDTGVLEFPPTP